MKEVTVISESAKAAKKYIARLYRGKWKYIGKKTFTHNQYLFSIPSD